MSASGWRMALWIALVGAILWFIYLVRGILLPFILAFALAAILHPLVKRLEAARWPRWSAVAAVLTVFMGSIGALGVWLTPIVGQQVVGFKERADTIATGFLQPDESANFFLRWNPSVRLRDAQKGDVLDALLSREQPLLQRLGLPSTKRAIYAQYIEPQRAQIQRGLRGFLQGFLGIASGLVSQILILLFVPILVIPILLGLEGMQRKLFNLVPPTIRPTAVALFRDIGSVFSRYLRGVTIAVVGYTVVMSVLLSVLGAPYGLLLGVLFGMVYLVPYFNVAICATTLAAVTLLSGTTSGPLFGFSAPGPFVGTLLGIFLVVHFTYDMIVYPQTVGRAVGLDPIVSMFVIFSGGALFGVPGMILAFPLAGSVKVILGRLFGFTNRVERGFRLPPIPPRHRASTDPLV